MYKNDYNVSGNGYTIPDRDKMITKWENITAKITIYSNGHYDIIGSGFSYLKHKEYYFLLTSIKISNKYYLVKTTYDMNNIPVTVPTITYKLDYNLDDLTFNLKSHTEHHGNINGFLKFNINKQTIE